MAGYDRLAELTGSAIELKAPDNPYRGNGRAMSDDEVFGPLMAGDTGSGPGLLADDIDRIARRHHALGRREAEREADERIAEMQRRLATAFDQGFAAGRVERAAGFARAVRSALMSTVWFRVLAMRDAKTKAAMVKEVAPALDGLRDVLDTLDGVMMRTPDHVAATLVADGEMQRRPVT